MRNRRLIIGLVSFILIVECIELAGQENKSLEYSIYAGVQRKFIHGSGIHIIDPQLIDPTYPYNDSIRFLPNFSLHSGVALSVNVVHNIDFSIGLEWNLRKSFIKLYGDSILASGYRIPGYNIEHNLSHNLEIPCYLSYNSKRFGIGGGIKATLLEFRIWKGYSNERVISRGFSFAHFPRPLTDNILFPIAYAEYLIVSDLKFPLWIRASYEFGYNSSSIMYISIITKL